jgi:signal peptidase I
MDEIDEQTAPTPAGDPPSAEFAAAGDAPERKAEESAAPTGPVPPPATPSTPPADKKKPAEHESIIETVKTVVYALLIALVIRTFLFQPFNIPSGSMEATLLIGDYLFVEKFAYGYSQYSFPWGLGPISGRVWAGDGPQRGDVIVFKLPRDNSTDYIKRVIGLPGDRIQLINGQIYLNNKAVPRVRAPDYVEDDVLGTPRHITRYRETLPNGKSYLVLARDPGGLENNTDVYVVPAGHYFMMGDNRDNSLDSRFAPTGKGDVFDRSDGVGYVPAANLVGKAEFIFFSNDGPLWEFWTWPWTVRFSRMFTSID